MYDYSSHPKVKKRSLKKLLLVVFALVLAFFIFKSIFFKTKVIQLNSPLPAVAQTATAKPLNKEKLLEEIQKITSGNTGTYSVYINQLNENKPFGINEHVMYTAASVNKVPVLAVLYYLVDQGKIDLDKTITLQAKDIQDYGTGSIRYDKPGTVYSIKTLARLMMEQSDNTAYYLLNEQIIGADKVQETINDWGLIQTDMKLNKTSNSDQEKLFRLIYENKIASVQLTAEMLEMMDDSLYEDRLPALLPADITIYHKIGNEIRQVHDVGIIDLEGNPYYLGVLVSDNPSDENAVKLIAQISKLVFDYMTKK